MLHSASEDAIAAAPEDRRSRLLEEAAREFNARGIAGASFARIARRIGLTRAALYYYVRDRDELAEQCYRHTCEVMAADLAAASRSQGSGLERIVDFLRRTLNTDRAPSAVLSELDYFHGRARQDMIAAHAANVMTLRTLLRAGMADGSIRLCDDLVAAQVLIGTLAWVPLSMDWVEGTDSAYRRRTAEALTDLFVNGEVADRSWRFEPRVSISQFFAAPAGAFDRQAAQAAKIEALLMQASQLFNRRGIDGVSLDDVADQVGATKGVLYHYFRNKTDLVVRCYRRAFTLYERFVDAADAEQSAIDRAFTGTYLNIEAHVSGLSPLIQLVGVDALPAAARREMTKRARQLQQRFEAYGRQAHKDGQFRDIDFGTVAQLGAGAFEWLPKWLVPMPAGHIAREILSLFAYGLKA